MKRPAQVSVVVMLVLAMTIAVLAATVATPGLVAGGACTNFGWQHAFVSCAFAQSARGFADDPPPPPDPVIAVEPAPAPDPVIADDPAPLPTKPGGPRVMVGWR